MATKEVNEKHLEFIEDVIDRMGRNSFQCKTWCFSIITALLVFLFSRPVDKCLQIRVLGTSVAALVVFCLLDTFYLYKERGYRELYKIVAGLDNTKNVQEYDMRIPDSKRGIRSYIEALPSPATGLCYGPICLMMILAYIFS